MNDRLREDMKRAAELGLSYGRYKAMQYSQQCRKAPPTTSTLLTIKKSQRRKRKRSFTDAEAFELWQTGMTDLEIATKVGVSRAYIQKWRDTLELPSTSRTVVDTKKYRLGSLQDGTAIILTDDDEI